MLGDKRVMLGVLDLGDPEVESPETVAAHIRRALPYVSVDRLLIAPDCGMKYLPRHVAEGKMRAMAAGAALVRGELSGQPGPDGTRRVLRDQPLDRGAATRPSPATQSWPAATMT
jgi:hypothetical protein